MKRFLKKALTLVTLISVVFTISAGLTSCDRRYDEDEVVTAARVLLKKAEMLNLVYYGDGIQYYDEDDGLVYKRADSTHLEELGFSSISGLRELTLDVFTEEYANIMALGVLETVYGADVKYVRYFQHTDDETKESYIVVRSTYGDDEKLLHSKIEYDYDSLHTSGSKKEYVFVTVTATVTNKEGKSQKCDITITMLETDAGWRFDSPTFANYSEYRDQNGNLAK